MSSTKRHSVGAACAALVLSFCAPAGRAAEIDFKPTGVVYYDALDAQPDVRPFEDVAKVRSGRLGFVLKGGSLWQLNVEHEFTDRSTPDLNLQLTPAKGHVLRLGQFKQPFLLEDATSSRQTPLMEASLLGAFAIGRRIGASYGYSNADMAINGAVFGQRLDGKNEGLGVAARASRVFKRSEGGLVHLGAGIASESPDSDSARFSTRPESALATSSLVDTGTRAGVDRIQRAGLEALWIAGPYSLQGEVAAVRADIGNAPDLRGSGGYALASWSPSGHRRSYKAGTVSSPVLGDRMAWELFARYSTIDLNSAASKGGREADWAFGATWYINPYVRVMANYILADSRRRGIADDPRLMQMRVQLAF